VKYHNNGGRRNNSNNGYSRSDEAETSKKDGGKEIWKGKGRRNLISPRGTHGHFFNDCWSRKGINGNYETHVAEEE